MSKKIMIVEDESSLANMYRLQFELGGFEVWLAHNGEECLKLVRRCLPDLILLDIMMPKMDGYETLRKLRSFKLAQRITICFLSNLDQNADVRLGLANGADYYFTKSAISPKQLLNTVQSLVFKDR